MKCRHLGEDREVDDDWPAVPDSCLDGSIQLLAEFPEATRFYELVSEDRCTLFAADRSPPQGSFPPNHYYVAIWHEHLQEALERNLVRDLVVKEGAPICPLGYFRLTPNGHRFALLSHLTLEAAIWPLFGAVQDFLIQGKYGTAVREAVVRLEQRIRDVSGTSQKLHGRPLLQHILKEAPGALRLSDKDVQLVEARYGRFFSFVRNEFAHKLSSPDLATAISLITRCAGLCNTLSRGLGYLDDEDLAQQVYGTRAGPEGSAVGNGQE